AWVPVLSMEGRKILDWTSVSGRTYQVWSTTNLGMPFVNFGGMVTAAGPTLEITNNLTNSQIFYRVQLFP
ncbi:MAG TPA: hypothetical protein VGY98_20780, partial [Verrucomicrobiae bacterium]|nr:hypothetical protein [Verrucomicrobiae bacterium]